MAEILLVNPARRRRRSSKRPSAAQLRARAKFAAMARARSRSARRASPARRRRRRNPVPALPRQAAPMAVARRRVRRNPTRSSYRRVMRRRRNPISLGGARGYVQMIQQGLIGGAGAVAMDVAYGYINGYLPATLQRTPGAIGIGDAVKAAITVALGKLLARPTRGLSMQAARGALTVQAHGLIAGLLPSTVTLGYATPARVVNMSNRIGPNRLAGLARYTAPGGATPMLSRYASGAASPLLDARSATMMREMVVR